jgi:hypothetical protein
MKKGTLVAIGVFAALLLLVLATRERQVSEGLTQLELPGLDKDKIVAVEISGAQSATLRKEGGAWVVLDPAKPDQKHPADEAQVRSALDSLPQLKSSELVTEKPEKQAELEVDTAHGRKVLLKTEHGPVAELIFGKAARSGTYVRKADSSAVFVTSSALGGMVRRELNSWRKRDFVGVKPEELAQVTVRLAGAEPYTLKAGDGGTWALAEGTQTPAGFRFDPQAARALVQQLASLSAQDFAQDSSEAANGLAGAHDVIVAQLKDAKTVTLHLGAQASPQGLVPVRKEGDPQVYLAPAYAQGLRKKLGDLRDVSLLSFDPQKVTRLAIQAGDKKTVAVKDGTTWKLTEPKKLPDGFEFDPGRVAAQLSGLRSIRAFRQVDPPVSDAEAGLSKPSAVVELALEGGASQSVRFGKEVPSSTGAQELYVKGAVDSALYAIPQAERTRFEPGVELFKKRPPPPEGSAQMQGLENLPPDIRRQIEEQLRARAHP